MKSIALALLSAYAVAAPFELDARNAMDPPPQQVSIASASYSGNGCPQGSVSSVISDDKSVVTFGFDRFQAIIGPKAAQSERSKNCQIHLNLRYPSGFQLSLMEATYHGYVRLDDGVSASFISSYYFSQNAGNTASSRADLRGAEYKSGKIYEKKDSIEHGSTVWSPCGANGILNVNNRIGLSSTNNRGEGEISKDDATFKFTQKVHFQWRRCNGKARYVNNPAPSEGFGKFNTTMVNIA